ncbi:hypothetical protein GGQ59_002809 [Parvularcula dongshanensis]|uniref:Uncharacterized protein n=1 Tax=Parvularcula dongshanensis TaxID=1173995 RepID=A0A840I5V8_9PROT|nr:hypothetical protein [Parvularcula dongshanensis]
MGHAACVIEAVQLIPVRGFVSVKDRTGFDALGSKADALGFGHRYGREGPAATLTSGADDAALAVLVTR